VERASELAHQQGHIAFGSSSFFAGSGPFRLVASGAQQALHEQFTHEELGGAIGLNSRDWAGNGRIFARVWARCSSSKSTAAQHRVDPCLFRLPSG